MDELERNCKLALWRLAWDDSKLPISEDDLTRELVVTPFDGSYGQARLVVAINGSPPRGVAIVRTVGKQAVELWILRKWGRNGAIRFPVDTLHLRAGWRRKAARAIVSYLIDRGYVGG